MSSNPSPDVRWKLFQSHGIQPMATMSKPIGPFVRISIELAGFDYINPLITLTTGLYLICWHIENLWQELIICDSKSQVKMSISIPELFFLWLGRHIRDPNLMGGLQETASQGFLVYTLGPVSWTQDDKRSIRRKPLKIRLERTTSSFFGVKRKVTC